MANTHRAHGNTSEAVTAVIVCLLSVMMVCDARAGQIYKSIDAFGHVTYSEHPPEDAKQVEKIDVPKNYDVDMQNVDSTRHDEIKAAAEELEEDRKQREQEREAARKKLADEEAKQAKQPAEPEVYHHYIYPPHRQFPGRPRPPRPRPPIAPVPEPRPRPLPR